MTNDQSKNLALALLKADSEDAVIDLLITAGYWDDPAAWRFVGDRDGNFATIGSQQSRPEAALVEKIVNSVDARLMNECLRSNINPTSMEAPPSIRHAVSRFFEGREPEGRIGGTLQGWSQDKQREQSKYITIAITGETARNGDPCVTITDKGEGQTPLMIPKTLLSIDRNNKLKIRFVQGKFNMGGTGALRFCGQNSLQLIITKRNPQIVAAPGEKDTSRSKWGSKWGFTVVRRERPTEGAGQVRNSIFSYLAPVNAKQSPRRGDVLSFEAKRLPLMPVRNKPYEREIEGGTAIKLYEYDMKGFRSHVLMRGGLLSRLELLLPSIALPIRVHECRMYRGDTARSFENTLVGISARLDENRAENLEAGFPTSVQLKVRGEHMSAQVYAFKGDRAGAYRTNEGIIFVLNGQTHGYIPKTFFERSKVKMGRLAKSLLVVVECSGLSVSAREDLFMNSRDRLSNKDIRKALENELEAVITQHPGLRDLRERRRREEIGERLKDARPLEEVLGSILKNSPTLARLFLQGQRLHQPYRAESRRGKGRDGGPERGPGSFEARKHPSYFEFYQKGAAGALVREAQLGRRCRIKFETDVENEYFSRPVQPGRYHVELLEGPVDDVVLDHSMTLHNGIANWSINLPQDDLSVGDALTIRCTVVDDVISRPFVRTAKLSMIGMTSTSGSRKGRLLNANGTGRPGRAGKDQGSGGEQGEGAKMPGGLQMPTVINVSENDDNWKRHGFDARTACMLVEDADGDGDEEHLAYTFYVNVDNVYLKTDMKDSPKEVAAMRAKFVYGNVLVGLALVHDRRNGNGRDGRGNSQERSSEESVPELVERTTRALGPFLVPMIDYLGALSEEEVAGIAHAGDED